MLETADGLKPNVLIQDALRRRTEQIAARVNCILHGDGDPDVGRFPDGFAKETRRGYPHNFKGGVANLNRLAQC